MKYLRYEVTDLILKFDHVEINVKDVKKAMDFFIKKLGFKLESVIEGEGVFVKSGDVSIGLFEGEPLGLKHIAFTVDDVEKSYRELKDKGVEFLFEPLINAYTGRMVVDFKDLDGNVWQLTKKVKKGLAEST